MWPDKFVPPTQIEEQPSAVIIVDFDGIVRTATPTIHEFFGCIPDDMIGLTLDKFLYDETDLKQTLFCNSFVDTFAIHIDGQSSRPVHLQLSAFPERQEIVIMVSDGRSSLNIQRLRAKHDIAIAANSLPLDSVMEMVYHKINQLIDTQFFFIGLLDHRSGQITLKYLYDNDERLPDQTVSADANHSISGWVTHHRRSLFVRDFERDPLPTSAVYYGIPVRSGMYIPLIVEDAAVGLLSVQSMQPNAFSEQDQELLENIARTIAVSLRNAQLIDSMQKRLREVDALQELAQATTGAQDIVSIIDTVVHNVRRVFHCRVCIIAMREGQEMVVQAAAGLSDEQIQVGRWPLGEGIYGKIATTGETIYLPDINHHKAHLLDDSIRSLMAVPLVVKDQVIGTLAVGSHYPSAFTADHERILTIMAAQITAAIENARLLYEAKARTFELEAAYADLQEYDRLRQETVENVAHDLRSPLTVIQGYLDFMLEEGLGPITDDQSQALAIIDRKLKLTFGLIEDIQDLEKISADTLYLQLVNLTELARQTVEGARLAYADHRINFVLKIPDDAIRVEIDPMRIDQVLGNLISNAVKFSERGSTITVACHQHERWVRVSVTDQGIGISRDKLARIFERFYRVPGTRKDGIGIGLALVKCIIDAHLGNVYVESEVGRGSTFSFDLPL